MRHLRFFEGDDEVRLNDLLFTHSLERIVLDSRAVFAGPCVTEAEKEAFANKPRVPARAVALGQTPIVRFIGQTEPDANPPFWSPWVDTVSRWLADGRSPIVFIHTPDNVAALELCHRFHEDVRTLVPGLAPLPTLAESRDQRLFE